MTFDVCTIQTSGAGSAAVDYLPLHIARDIHQRQREEAALIERAPTEVQVLLPIGLALARMVAAEDARSAASF